MKKYVLIVMCAILLTACFDRFEEHYYLSESVKQLVPYKEGEEVRFTNEFGTIITLTVKKLEDSWWDFSEHESKSWYQCRNIKLQSNDSSDGFDLGLEEWRFLSIHEPRITLVFQPIDRKVKIDFDLDGNFVGCVVYDEVMIGEQKYHDVAIIQTESFQCYYNKTYGVLQVKENDKVFLERLP